MDCFCRLLHAIGVSVPSFSTEDCKEFTARAEYWWSRFTNCVSFSKQSPRSKRRFHNEVQTDGVSVSVTMFKPEPTPPPASAQPPPPKKGTKRKRQEQTSTEWVRGLPDKNIGQPQRIVGLDPGRKALFTAAIHSQSAADSLTAQRSHGSKYTTISWSSGKWREASGINYRLRKTNLWLNRKPAFRDALQDTPSAKVASSASYVMHIQHRMQHEAAAVGHFGDMRHRQLRWRTFIKRQQAYTVICKDISAGSADTVVAYGDASFSSSCCKGNPSTPTVSLRRTLGRHCKVFDTDEFRTSRLCCACKTAMDGMPLPLTGNPLPYQQDDMQTPYRPLLHMLARNMLWLVCAHGTLESQPTHCFEYTAHFQTLMQHQPLHLHYTRRPEHTPVLKANSHCYQLV